jgi:hypothetical protein
MPRSEARAASRARLAAPLVALAVAAALALAGCGGGGEGPAAGTEADQAPPPAPPGERSTAQPPPETAPDNGGGDPGDGSSEEAQEEALAEDAETGPLPCPDVVITPDSGNGLFDVEANGLTCEDATVALEAWGASGFPGTGPPGFSCEPVPEAQGRLSCVQEASGGVVEFTQGV